MFRRGLKIIWFDKLESEFKITPGVLQALLVFRNT
jgi:hypothetical protein